MKRRYVLLAAVWPASVVFGQAALQEPPDFPNAFPGPGVLRPGGSSCFQLATGGIVPGDVDWIQVTIPRASLQTVIDLDFPTGGGSAASSSMLVFVSGGATALNNGDGNGLNDSFCGLSGTSMPIGSTLDSAVSLGATPHNAVIHVGITGAGDGGFTGMHNRTFNYTVWVYIVPGPCVADGDCYDGVGCTVESCVLPGGVCLNTPNNSLCSNGVFCDGAEVCNATTGCQPGTPPNCDDGVACTVDSCSNAAGACLHAPDDLACDDGVFCNGAETCSASSGCVSGADPCPGMFCRESEGRCAQCQSDADCDDGAFCNGAETCSAAGACQPGTPPTCDDGVACTVDACAAALNACVHTPNNSACDNGSVCDGVESCDAVLGCQAGTPLTCDDGVFCNGVELCDGALGCLAGSDPCPGMYCREQEARCVECQTNADCDDGQFCNGAETCSAAGACQAGTPPTCDDGVACTVDACSAALNACVHTPDNTACDNGSVCDGAEWCDAALGCQAGQPLVCDDGVFCNGAELCDNSLGCLAGSDPCPGMYCREQEARCIECQTNADCDDGLFCNGAETCSAAGACQPGTPPTCDDGVFCNGVELCDDHLGCFPGLDPCPGAFCRESEARCVKCVSDAGCDDGQFCNGAETCTAEGFCQPGTPPNCDDGVPCTHDSCDSALNACLHVPDDSLCNDGSVCDGVEWCDATLGCRAGPPLVCDDGVFCNGVERCDDVSGCVAGADPCPGAFCRERERRCVECEQDSDCDDGDFCNGAETCTSAGTCRPGTPPCGPGERCDSANERCEAVGLALDLDPESCPNQFALNSRGQLKAALLATNGLDPRQIDLSTLELVRADGRGGSVMPTERKTRQPRFSANLSGFSVGGCNCQSAARQRGFGLLLTFEAESVASLVQLGPVAQRSSVELAVRGRLLSGTSFMVSDCMTVVGVGRR